jgi:hypothetical protein
MPEVQNPVRPRDESLDKYKRTGMNYNSFKVRRSH